MSTNDKASAEGRTTLSPTTPAEVAFATTLDQLIAAKQAIADHLEIGGYRLSLALTGLGVLQQVCHNIARKGGWWTDLQTGQPKDRNDGELLCLIHSEISEAMEGVRKNLMDDKIPTRKMVEVELADAIIRILDYAGGRDLDVAGAVMQKLAFNISRADHKIENRKAEGGKAF